MPYLIPIGYIHQTAPYPSSCPENQPVRHKIALRVYSEILKYIDFLYFRVYFVLFLGLHSPACPACASARRDRRQGLSYIHQEIYMNIEDSINYYLVSIPHWLFTQAALELLHSQLAPQAGRAQRRRARRMKGSIAIQPKKGH